MDSKRAEGCTSRQDQIRFSCCHCSLYFGTQRDASKHARQHSGNPYFRIVCPICKRFFTSVPGWSRHLKTHNIPEDTETSRSHVVDTDSRTSESVDEDNTRHPSAAESETGPIYDSRKELASLIVRLRAKNVIESSCRDVLDFVHSFTTSAIKEYEEGKGTEHEERGSSGCSEPDVPCLKNCAKLLGNDHLEATALKEFDIVEPETIVLGKDEKGKEHSYQFISLKDQLSSRIRTLSSEDVLSPSDDPDELKGLQDGTAHRTVENDTLSLVLYYDGFQAGNPLGNKAKEQTLGGIYCSIGNVRSQGKLDDIFCVLLFEEQLLEKYTWTEILEILDARPRGHVDSVSIKIGWWLVALWLPHCMIMFLPVFSLW
ncbi:uncharacterized protein LOC122369175 [Amphibalanus amphitrite]|uniref:uncharacterized protein LOC122369175 n=1 Tax=Amphibalanus amphitrite TaxID=1232801 RepID=UPI001C8FEA0A|nr:uncharacterized protein LOC122369175 [Amphibalanus amphitrite]